MTDFLKTRRHNLLIRLLQADAEGKAALAETRSLESAARDFSGDAVLFRLDHLADLMPPDEMAAPGDTRRAGQMIAQNVRSALAKFRHGDMQSITEEEEASTEAVIIADGSRPTLLLKDGRPPIDHPMIGAWRGDMTALQEKIAESASAICRVEPAEGSAANYFGTGFLIDAAQGLVLTNQHVLDALLQSRSTEADESGGTHRIKAGAFVEFNGELGMGVADRRRFQVVEARRTPVPGQGADDVNFERLDIAVLKIAPLPESPQLPPVPDLELSAERADGSLISFCSIGFPGPPASAFGVINGIDFGVVHSQLFGGRYGLKRITVGKVHHPVGTLHDDPRKWVFGHDGTTLGGASGSPIIAWLDGNRICGIHFAGMTGKSNYAHSFFAARDALGEFDLPIG